MQDKQSILVVDDEDLNLLLIEAMLAAEYRILTASSGREAGAILAREAVDLVLLDIMMPEEDGFAVCARFKASPATRDIPVIFITALTDQESEARGIAAGAVDFIQKPVAPLVLRARVQAHLDLAALRFRLSHLLDERTAELEHLRHKAELASDVKSAFIRNMHDVLKNPLSSVIGFGQLLLDETDLATCQSYAQIIVDSGRRISRLLTPMMEFVDFDHDRLADQQERVDLTLLLLEAGGLVEPLLAERQVRLDYDFDPETSVWLTTNLAGLRRAVFELLSNAVRHSPRDGVVRLAFAEEAGRYWIGIDDQGEGIPEALQARVFEPFDRLGERIGEEGLGLGLALAKRIVDGLDGRLGFECPAGGGTRFRIEFAAVDRPPLPRPAGERSSRPPRHPGDFLDA